MIWNFNFFSKKNLIPYTWLQIGANAETFQPLLECVPESTGLACVALDRPGWGLSGRECKALISLCSTLITSRLCLVCVAIAHALSKSEQLHREQHDEYLPPQRRASRQPLRSLSTSDLPSLDTHTNASPLSDQPPPPPPAILSDIDSPKQIQHVCFFVLLFCFHSLVISVFSAFNTVENQCIIQWFVCCRLCGTIGTTIRIHACCGNLKSTFPYVSGAQH